jgi:hypothetical protein
MKKYVVFSSHLSRSWRFRLPMLSPVPPGEADLPPEILWLGRGDIALLHRLSSAEIQVTVLFALIHLPTNLSLPLTPSSATW